MSPHRLFHDDSNSKYFLPNDTEEQVELNEQAIQFESVMQNNVLHAPISKPTRILDMGCGTGYVTFTFATSFPNADVFGLDLSDVPQTRKIPPNVHFVRGNVLTQSPTSWKQEDHGSSIAQDEGAFDLVFSRLLISGMNDWPGYARRVYDFLKPGGWIEVHELDADFLDANGKFVSEGWEWFTRSNQAICRKGLTYSPNARVKEAVQNAGFTDIRVIPYKLPVGGSLEENPELQAFGDFWAERLKHVYEVIITNELSGDVASLEQMRRDLSETKGTYTMFYVTIGRKPQ